MLVHLYAETHFPKSRLSKQNHDRGSTYITEEIEAKYINTG
jgi:hypothetical protein